MGGKAIWYENLTFNIKGPLHRAGLNPSNKKSQKNFPTNFWILDIVILPKILRYYFQKSGQLAAPKNWIQFFSDLSKKI